MTRTMNKFHVLGTPDSVFWKVCPVTYIDVLVHPLEILDIRNVYNYAVEAITTS